MANVFNESLESLKLLDQGVDIYIAKLKKAAVETQKISEGLSFESSKDLKALDDQLAKITKATEALNKAEKEKLDNGQKIAKAEKQKQKDDKADVKNAKAKAKEREKLFKLTDSGIKQGIKERKQRAQRKKDIEAELILEQKSIRTRTELQERLKALRIEANKLDLGSDKLEQANEEINKLTERLTDNSDQFIKNKINIGNYKSATEDLTESFEDQKKKLKILVDVYKEFASQGKKNTAQAKELKSELEKQKKAIKEVEDATEDAEKATNKFSSASKAIGLGLLIAVIAKLADLFGTSREASLEASKQMAIFTETISAFFASLVNSWESFKTIFVALKESTQSFFISFEKGWLNLLISIEKGKGIFSDTDEEIQKLEKRLNSLTKEQEALANSTNTVAEGYKGIVDAFSDQASTTEKAINFQQKYLQLQLDTKIQIEAQTRALAGLQERRQILQDISDDDTLGFETRALAVKKSQDATVEFAEKEETLARLKETLTIQAIKGELLKAKVLSDSELRAIKTGEQLNALLKNRAIALKISDETEQAFTEAFVERVDKQTEALSFARDQEEKNRKTFRDSYEQRLDIIEEFGELQFALNEALLNNDKASQEERNAIFAKNQKLSNDLLKQGIELTLEQGKKSIDLNKDLTESEKDLAKAKLDNADIGAILNAQSEQERFELIRKLDLGEIEEKRLKETFKIRFDQNNALIEQQESLNESNRVNLELEREIALQEIALKNTTNKKLEELDKSRIELEKQNLQERIELLKEDSNERLELEKEFNDLLLEAREEDIEKDKERAEERKELFLSFLDAQAEAQREAHQERLRQIDAEIDAAKKQHEERRQDLRDGIVGAKENIEFSKKEQAEAEQRRIEEVKRQKRAEAELAIIKLLAANADQPNPVRRTTEQMIASQLIPQLLGFHDGVDDTGNTGQLKDKHGVITGYTHKNEQVWSEKDLAETGNKTRAEAKELMYLGEKSKMSQLRSSQIQNEEIKITQSFLSNSQIIASVESMHKGLRDELKGLPQRMPRDAYSWDAQEEALIHGRKVDNKITRNHYKNSGTFNIKK